MAALAQSIRRSAIGLGLFAIFTGGSIALTQALTHERIQAQAARAEARAKAGRKRPTGRRRRFSAIDDWSAARDVRIIPAHPVV